MLSSSLHFGASGLALLVAQFTGIFPGPPTWIFPVLDCVFAIRDKGPGASGPIATMPVIAGFSRLEPRFCVRIVCARSSDGQFMIAIYLKSVASIRLRRSPRIRCDLLDLI